MDQATLKTLLLYNPWIESPDEWEKSVASYKTGGLRSKSSKHEAAKDFTVSSKLY